MNKEISIIVPVYKEAESIKPFLIRMEAVLAKMALSYEIIFCLDPSPDNTAEIIQAEIEKNPNIKLIIFSRRFGQPAATMAGIFHSIGETCAIIDVDLQDPPELIESMYKKLKEGHEVVYARRNSRQGETFTKRLITFVGYKVINKISDVQIPTNTGDFRIMTRRVVQKLSELNETHGFLRGLVAYVGFKQTYISYDREPRITGKGNYNHFFGSIKIGLNGIFSFSSRPLQMMSFIGALIAVFSFLLGVLSPGLPTVVLVVSFFSGVQLLCLGLMGEYVGRIYDEVKRRPMFIVDSIIENQNSRSHSD